MIYPSRIRLLSVGVSDYFVGSGLEKMPVAVLDAQAVYSQFSIVFGERFDHVNSVTFINLTADRFRAIFDEFITCSKVSQDLAVFYFSGHGGRREEELLLHFVDSDTQSRGVVSQVELGESIRRAARPRSLLLLDCCFAGGATKLTGSYSQLFTAKTSVWASTGPFSRATYDDKSSKFTGVVLDQLARASESNEELTLAKWGEVVKAELAGFGMKPELRESEENEPLQLLTSARDGQADEDFVRHFLQTLLKSDLRTREGLWYALGDECEIRVIHVVERAFGEIHEPSWLVRRAIGSTISRIRILKEKKLEILTALIRSTWWMDCACGIIGARHDAKEKLVGEMLSAVAQGQTPMDAKWLAFLYLCDVSDCASTFPERLIPAQLFSSVWGVCEIWDRAAKYRWLRHGWDEEMLSILHKLIAVDGSRIGLIKHMYCNDIDAFNKLPEEYKEGLDFTEVEKLGLESLFTTERRGDLRPLNTSAQKWLDSNIYGVWRDAMRVPLKAYVDNHTSEELELALVLLGDISSVSFKLAFYEEASQLINDIRPYTNLICWGFEDSHPWVRRAAVEWGTHSISDSEQFLQYCCTALAVSSDRGLLPGMLDLILSTCEALQKRFPDDARMTNLLDDVSSKLTSGERKMLNWHFANQNLRFSLE